MKMKSKIIVLMGAFVVMGGRGLSASVVTRALSDEQINTALLDPNRNGIDSDVPLITDKREAALDYCRGIEPAKLRAELLNGSSLYNQSIQDKYFTGSQSVKNQSANRYTGNDYLLKMLVRGDTQEIKTFMADVVSPSFRKELNIANETRDSTLKRAREQRSNPTLELSDEKMGLPDSVVNARQQDLRFQDLGKKLNEFVKDKAFLNRAVKSRSFFGKISIFFESLFRMLGLSKEKATPNDRAVLSDTEIQGKVIKILSEFTNESKAQLLSQVVEQVRNKPSMTDVEIRDVYIRLQKQAKAEEAARQQLTFDQLRADAAKRETEKEADAVKAKEEATIREAIDALRTENPDMSWTAITEKMLSDDKLDTKTYVAIEKIILAMSAEEDVALKAEKAAADRLAKRKADQEKAAKEQAAIDEAVKKAAIAEREKAGQVLLEKIKKSAVLDAQKAVDSANQAAAEAEKLRNEFASSLENLPSEPVKITTPVDGVTVPHTPGQEGLTPEKSGLKKPKMPTDQKTPKVQDNLLKRRVGFDIPPSEHSNPAPVERSNRGGVGRE